MLCPLRHEFFGTKGGGFFVERMGDDHVDVQASQDFGAFVRRGQPFELNAANHQGWMWGKGKHNGRRAVRTSACRQLADDLLMAAVHTIKNPDGKPATGKRYGFQRAVMLHEIYCRGTETLCPYGLRKKSLFRLPLVPGFVQFEQRHQFACHADTAYHASCICRGRDAVAVLDGCHLVRVEFNSWPVTQRFGGRDQILVPIAGAEGFLQFSQGSGVAQAEAPALGAAQAHQVAAAAEGITHIIRERADVGAGGAVHIHDHFRRRPFQYFEVMDGDLTRGEIDFFAFTGHVISATALDFHSRIGWWRLLDLTNKLFEGFFELLLGDVDRGAGLLRETAICVVGVRRGAKADDGLVALVGSRDVLAQAYSGPYENDQHAGGARIERASMPGAADACPDANGLHHVVGGDANRFVYDENTGNCVFKILVIHQIPPVSLSPVIVSTFHAWS